MLAQRGRDIHDATSLPFTLDSELSPESFEKTQMRMLKVGGAKDDVHPLGFNMDSDRVAEIKQKSLNDQRHLEAYRNIHRLRDILSRHYAELLKEKVQRQRYAIKQHNSAILGTTEKLNEQIKKSTFQKLIGSTFHHDLAYLRSLPKTRHYLVLDLQRHLGQRGCLQGFRQQEMFRHWVHQNKTAQLEKKLQKIVLHSKAAPELKMEDLLKSSSALPKIQVSADGPPRRSCQITVTEVGEGGEVGTPRLPGSQALTQTQTQDQAKLKLPKVFSRELQVPHFYALQPSFLENLCTDILFLRTMKPPSKSNTAATTKHKLRHMHNISLCHMARAQRLLEISGLTSQYDKGFSMKDLLALVHQMKVLGKEAGTPEESPPPQPLREEPTPGYSPALKEDISAPLDEVTSSQASEFSQSRASDSWKSMEPLSIENISSQVSQSTGLGEKMWTNYVQ